MPRRSTKIGIAAGAVAAAAVITTAWSFARGDGDREINSRSIVMLGDSITEQGEWHALLPSWSIVNRGRSGYTTAQLVPVAEGIAAKSPQRVFVLTGTNDIRDGHAPEWTARHLGELLDTLERESPSTTIVVQTILPRDDRPQAARATADAIEMTATSRGVRVLDLYAPFDDGTGRLRADETTDGVHLSAAGYERWASLLVDELRRR